MRHALTVVLILALSGLPTAHALADDTGMAANNSWRKEKGKTCFADHFHTGNGDGKSKRAAKIAAIRSWREFTAWEYGTDWAVYRRAAGKKVTYTKAAVGWSASVDARPCNSKRNKRRRRSRRKR